MSCTSLIIRRSQTLCNTCYLCLTYNYWLTTPVV
jgi:hypothetical protein